MNQKKISRAKFFKYDLDKKQFTVQLYGEYRLFYDQFTHFFV